MFGSIPRFSSPASVSYTTNEQQKQSNTFFTCIKKLVLDLKSTCLPTKNNQPAANPTVFIHAKKTQLKPFSNSINLKVSTRGQNVEAETLKKKHNWQPVPDFYEAICEHAYKNPDATGKELDKYMSIMYTENIIKLAQKDISPVDLAVSINSLNAYSIFNSNVTSMIKFGVERYSNNIQSIINEKDPVKLSVLLSDFKKESPGDKKSSLVPPHYTSRKIMDDVLNNPKLSANQKNIIEHLHSDGLSKTVLAMTMHPLFENKTDGDFLNAILKLNNTLIPQCSRIFCFSTFKWAGENRNKECIKVLFDNTKSYHPHFFESIPFMHLAERLTPDSIDFIEKIYCENRLPMTPGEITQHISPEELKDLLQKHDSGEQYIRSVDFLSWDPIFTEAKVMKILISRPEVPTVHILHAQIACLKPPIYTTKHPCLEIIDAELARRAGQQQ